MRIDVWVKSGAKEDLIERISESEFKVNVKKPPREGAANEAVVHSLSKYFGVPRSSVRLIKGRKSRRKIFNIRNENN